MKNESKIVYAIACSSSSTDKQTNNISLFSLLEDLKFDGKLLKTSNVLPEKISLPIQFEIVILFSRTNTSKAEKDLPIAAKIDLIDPNEKSLMNFPINTSIQDGKKRFRMNIKVNGVSATTSGTYVFRVNLLKDESDKNPIQIFDVPIDININISDK
ncbi:MAG TPA: hypothetical protein VJB58_00530 [Candidatus Paceibacterota bacterium]